MRPVTQLYLLVTLWLSSALALHLEVPASSSPKPVCIRDFVQRSQLVVVNIKTNGQRGDGQKLDLTISDQAGNEYRRINDLGNTASIAITSDSTAIDICFTNSMAGSWRRHAPVSREIELEVESGAAARDWNAVQASEKLKPVELDLRRIQELTNEISQELQYLKAREERMRDTNESTNSRVKWFSILTFLCLVGLGTWQIQYLRHYFKVKHII